MFKVDVPARMSTPGHSTSGADAVGEAGCVTPGVAPEKKPVNRLPNDPSDDPTSESERAARERRGTYQQRQRSAGAALRPAVKARTH